MPGQFIPPNGFAGFAQQTPAVQSLYRGKRKTKSRRTRSGAIKGMRGEYARRKKIPKSKRLGARKKKAARLVKGSAAAKRYMASIRRKRK